MPSATALVVDDHSALAENVVDLLRLELDEGDLSVRLARTVAEALAAADSALDLALVDLHLPDGSGAEVLHALRQRAPFAQVVILTGDASLESAIGALDRGAFSYLLKPFRPEDLVERARRAIDRARLLREREVLRADLERSEARYRSVIESVPAFVVALDEDGRIQLWNRHLEAVSGFARDEMLGRQGAELIGDRDGDYRLSVKAGGHILVRWRRSQVSPELGRAPLTFAVGVDVTEEREMQLRTLRAERLAAVGTLAAGLAHEVRNPLNSASLQLRVLERRLGRGETELPALLPVLSLVDGELRRLDRLVSEFLAFARPAPLTLGTLDLNALAASVGELVRPECDAAGVTLSLDLAALVEPIQADAERLRQVLLNLLRNALEAMAGPGAISIATRPADARGLVRIDVTDSGPGFPENAPVFDAFYTTKEQGTGLGLSIVHSIVADHGGTIGVESTAGRTCFTIRLPATSR
ncbi:MAG: response regulator [Deltaproteobacteria bacterium]|nr:response regulator [Deltaproteobacteria bacterium]